jgi:hypothetical protein
MYKTKNIYNFFLIWMQITLKITNNKKLQCCSYYILKTILIRQTGQ